MLPLQRHRLQVNRQTSGSNFLPINSVIKIALELAGSAVDDLCTQYLLLGGELQAIEHSED